MSAELLEAPPDAAPAPRPAWTGLAARAALVLAIVLAWLPGLRAPFTYDDRVEVVGNRTIRWLTDLDAIAAYNTSRPVLILTYAVNWWLGGLDPLGYHLLSVGIHAVNALLAWRLAGRLLTPARAALVATLWALHPMTTEAVTYVTGRSDALEATWWLLAVTAWIDHRRGARRGAAWTGFWVLLAVLTKETGWLLPAALVAVDAWLVPARRWREHLAFFAVAGAAIAVRLSMYGVPAAEVPRGVVAQVFSQAEVWARYVQLWLVPVGQSILHDHPGVARISGVFALAAWALVATAAAVWARASDAGSPARVRAFALALGGAWLFPSSALPLLETMAEHRAYLAGFALILALVATIPEAFGRFGRGPPGGGSGRREPRAAPQVLLWALVPLLAWGTVARNRVWSDEATLWEEAVTRNERSPRALYGLGEALRLQARYAQAATVYEVAAKLDPADPDARIGRGIALAELGRTDEARATWEEVLRLDPKSCPAHNDLGALAFRAGKLEEAVASYESTLAWCPDDPIANLNLANIAWQRADTRKAAFHYREYLRVAEDGPAAPLARERLKRMGVE